MFKVNNKDTRTTPLNIFSPSSTVSIVNFEHVNADWIWPIDLLFNTITFLGRLVKCCSFSFAYSK